MQDKTNFINVLVWKTEQTSSNTIKLKGLEVEGRLQNKVIKMIYLDIRK